MPAASEEEEWGPADRRGRCRARLPWAWCLYNSEVLFRKKNTKYLNISQDIHQVIVIMPESNIMLGVNEISITIFLIKKKKEYLAFVQIYKNTWMQTHTAGPLPGSPPRTGKGAFPHIFPSPKFWTMWIFFKRLMRDSKEDTNRNTLDILHKPALNIKPSVLPELN